MKHDGKKKILRRLKIAQGQIGGLERMVEADKYCVGVIHQFLAIKEALSAIEDLILENHIATHVAHQMRSGESARATKELVSLYKLSKKK